jgi:glycosyltransferase involved in cell wall biosynthesis
MARNGGRCPEVSIVTPSYNQGRFIEETIRSVLLQGYANLEYIIVDGGSTDETLMIVDKYRDWIFDFQSGPDKGQSDALNKGFSRSSGVLLAWLCSDDVLMPGALASVSNIKESETEERLLIAGTSEYRDFSGKNILWKVKDIPENLPEVFSFGRKYFAQPSVFFTRAALGSVGKIDEDLHYAMDLDLWIRLAVNAKIITTEMQLSWMRLHDDAKTSRDELKTLYAVESILSSHSKVVSRGVLEAAIRDIRALRAGALSRAALISAAGGDRSEAWRKLVKGYREHPEIIFTRGWIGALLRVTLPKFARGLILRKPS